MKNKPVRRVAESEEPIIKMWTPYHITVSENYPFVPKGRFFNACSRGLCRFAMMVLSRYDRLLFGLRIEGAENLLSFTGGAVTICNHVNMLDCSMVNCAFRRKIYFPTLKSNIEIPFIRILVRLLGGIPIPEEAHALRAFSADMEQLLREGKIVHIYPEGMLYPYYDGIRPFRRGAFCFAYDCNVPLIPFVITSRPVTGWRRRLKKHPFLTLTVLPPLYPDPDAPRRQEVERLRSEAFSAMQQHCDRMHRQQKKS